MRKFIWILAAFVFFFACSKEKTDTIVRGQWKWVESVPVVSPPLILQATTRPAPGETYILEFKTNNRFSFRHNGSTIRSGVYSIDNNINGNYPILSYSDDMAKYSITRHDDTLVLVSNALGAGFSKYSRY